MKTRKLNFATLVFLLGAIVSLGYMLTYLFPITDNAFVVNNVTPVAAMVDGYVDEIYVQNGQKLTKGAPILHVHPRTYELAYKGALAQYQQSVEGLKVLEKRIEVTKYALKAAQDNLDLLKYRYKQKSDPSISKGIPGMEIQSLAFELKSQSNTVNSLHKQIELEKQELIQAKIGIKTLEAVAEKAKDDVEETTVRAKTDGYVQDMFVGVGTAVRATAPLFSFVNLGDTYIQANLNETDLAHVREGDSVLIFPRTYLGHKVFHGVVRSSYWSVDRVHKNPIEGEQFIFSENKWLLLPQRMPIQIKVLDPNERYPLRAGMSMYVYIKTK